MKRLYLQGSGLLAAIIIVLGIGIWIGSNTNAFRETPRSMEECILQRLSGMQSNAAADLLADICYGRHGSYSWVGEAKLPWEQFDEQR